MAKAPILPDLPKLNDTQKSKIPSVCNTWPLDKLLHYLETGEILFSDLPNLDPNRRAILDQRLEAWRSQPNPPDQQEQNDWEIIDGYDKNIRSMRPDDRRELSGLLEKYIGSYSAVKPGGNHLSEAESLLNEIKKTEESEEWRRVPKSFDSVKNYLIYYPSTSFGFEAEKLMWGFAQSSMSMLKSFIETINSVYGSNSSIQKNEGVVSQHLTAAQDAVRVYGDWCVMQQRGEICEIYDFWKNNCPAFLNKEVTDSLNNLKWEKLRNFKANLSDAEKTMSDVELFFKLLDKGICTEDEYIGAGIVSRRSFELLKKRRSANLNLPLDQNDATAHPDGSKATDVFLFGIPSTGKTCVVMGLMGLMGLSDSVVWNVTTAGGKYGKQLKAFLDNGSLPKRTATKFVTLIPGEIIDRRKQGIKHPVNIVDMAGEAFADKIADNPDCIVAFEDMGIGATELLKSDNDKVFFIVVDPTSECVSYNKICDDGSPKTIVYSQHSTVLALCNLFADEKNAEIMRRVKAIHIITTKSDMLGDNPAYVAKNHIRENYKDVLHSLRDLCKESKFAINRESNYLPKLYTFSLGKFYIGSIYDYNPTDAEKLISVIEGLTRAIREETFIDKMRNLLNKTI